MIPLTVKQDAFDLYKRGISLSQKDDDAVAEIDFKLEDMLTAQIEWLDSSKPTVFLDVDGVVNVLGRGVREQETVRYRSKELRVIEPGYMSRYNERNTDRFVVVYDVRVADWLKQVVEQANLVWLTSWKQYAPILIDNMLGVDSCGMLWQRPRFSELNIVAKHRVLAEFVNAHSLKNFLWVDDELNDAYFESAWQMLEEKTGLIAGTDFYTVSTDNNIGLQVADTKYWMSRVGVKYEEPVADD